MTNTFRVIAYLLNLFQIAVQCVVLIDLGLHVMCVNGRMVGLSNDHVTLLFERLPRRQFAAPEISIQEMSGAIEHYFPLILENL